MEKRPYERPTIIRHATGFANKFGQSNTVRAKTEIDGVPVEKLMADHGSPLFVFSEQTLRKKIRSAQKTFETRYPKVQFAWSYKTNYLDAVCRVFHQEGAWAEVVSEFEYEMARRNGIPGDQIIYNGPYKPEAALRRAVAEGARIHLDGFDELYLLETIAKELGQPVEAAIRVNMDTGIQPAWDRFGFNLDNGEAANAARRMHAGGFLRLAGVHSHIGTFVLDPNAYRTAAARLGAFGRAMEKELDTQIEYVDLGGGFCSPNTLHAQYAPGYDLNPNMEAYAEAATSGLLEAGFAPDRLPLLVLETGRALVDEAGYLLTSVVGNKKLPTGLHSLVVDAGVGVLFTAFWYKHNVMPAKEKEGMKIDTVLYGPLCMNIDVIRPSVPLPPMSPGEALVIHPVGAYNVTQWMQFIRMRPAVVMVGESGQVDVIREKESIDTLKDLERVPGRLQ